MLVSCLQRFTHLHLDRQVTAPLRSALSQFPTFEKPNLFNPSRPFRVLPKTVLQYLRHQAHPVSAFKYGEVHYQLFWDTEEASYAVPSTLGIHP